MNKLSIITKSALIALSSIGIAYADPHASLNKSWTGFYVGAEAGVVLNTVQLSSQHLGFTNPEGTCNTSSDFSALSPGIQWGYLHQFTNSFVSGIEVDALFNPEKMGILNCDCPFNSKVGDRFTFSNQLQSSIKGRGGRVLNWNNQTLLPYLTAGVSFANVGLNYKNEGEDYYVANNNQGSWLIGTGLEWSLKQNWSLRAEYSYVNFGKTVVLQIPDVYGLYDPNGIARANFSSNRIIVSLNYWI